MSDWLLEQYDEYLVDFEAWGHEFFAKALTFDQFESLAAELEDIEIAEECGHLTKKQTKRREQIQRRTLTHSSYFEGGPRTIITRE